MEKQTNIQDLHSSSDIFVRDVSCHNETFLEIFIISLPRFKSFTTYTMSFLQWAECIHYNKFSLAILILLFHIEDILNN